MNIIDILVDFINKNYQMLVQLFIHLIILTIILKCLKHFANKLHHKIKNDPDNNTSLNLLLLSLIKLIKIIVIILVVASFLQVNGYSLTSIMTGLGITGLAVGFAAKEALSSVIGSISLMTDNVYKIGDYVIINDIEGYVESINFRSTKIRTLEDILITIPNNITADTIIQNRSAANKLKIVETIDIEYDTPDAKIDEAISIIKSICNNSTKIENNSAVYLSKLGENAISIQILATTKTKKWLDFLYIKESLLKEILKQFRENNINFAFPTRTIYLQNSDKNNEN